MTKLIYIGKITTTHGLKGEVKILSKNRYHQEIFKKVNNFIVNNQSLTKASYRPHQNYDLVSFNNYLNIDLIKPFCGHDVLVELANLAEIMPNYALIGYKVEDKKNKKGYVKDIENYGSCDILVVEDEFGNENLIAYIPDFISQIDQENKIIYLKE